jgi:hypothetical protein
VQSAGWCAVLIARPNGTGMADRPGVWVMATDVSRLMVEEWAASGHRMAEADG